MSYTAFDIQKRAMLEALEKSLGVVTTAAKTIGITRQTHYNWMEADEDYKKAVDSIADVALDFAESRLHQSIQNGSDTAVIFFLKTKGKKRGYVEKTIVESTNTNRVIMTDNDGEQVNPEDTDL